MAERRHGEGHPKARFSDSDIFDMRQLAQAGYGYRRIARTFDTSPSSVQSILTGRTRVSAERAQIGAVAVRRLDDAAARRQLTRVRAIVAQSGLAVTPERIERAIASGW